MQRVNKQEWGVFYNLLEYVFYKIAFVDTLFFGFHACPGVCFLANSEGPTAARPGLLARLSHSYSYNKVNITKR